MAIKVQFEIGHSSVLKLKKTSEGFTHDWELYVQGVDKADINQFVERVVFNLHNSFRKPKRSYKQPPYALKESGYAGFSLTIDIFFRNREEPRNVTFNYDLDLQQSGPPVKRKEIKRYVFENPSEDFRQRLLKGGGIPVVAGGSAVGDEKNRVDEINRPQLISKPKLSIDYGKKNKSRSDDKTNTFANLFGTPITKSAPKVSPDPKNKSSQALSNAIPVSLTQPTKDKGKEKALISNITSVNKEKIDKKERHKYNSPQKDKSELREENKKITDEKHDKHEKREEKKKDRIISKERERSREKAAKRQLSPKRLSPTRSSSAASREEPNGKATKQSVASLQAEKVTLTSTSNPKKSKKEKKSHEKDKDRDRREKDRSDSKHRDERSNSHSNSSIPMSSLVSTNEKQIHAKNSTRLNDSKGIDNNKKGKDSPLLVAKDISKDNKKPSDLKHISERLSGIEKKTSDKDEKRHKHKKKEKNKDKDLKDPGREKKPKEKAKHDISKKNQDSPSQKQIKNNTVESPLNIGSGQQKRTVLAPSTTSSQQGTSDLDSLDSDSGSLLTNPIIVPKPLQQSDSSSCSFPDILPTSKSSSSSTTNLSSSSIRVHHQQQQQQPQQVPIEETNIQKSSDRKDKKLQKAQDKSVGKVDGKRRKRNSPTINTFIEPPLKLPKRDMPIKNGGRDKPQSPQLPAGTTIIREDEMQNFRSPASSTLPFSNASNPAYDRSPVNAIPNAPSADYLCELQDLHNKIMTLRDNNELQKVVEMISKTGKYEITKKTFDFDLCTLDRSTVQDLQDFLATSVS